MKLLAVAVLILFSICAASAEEILSPWTNQPYPESVRDFPYAVKAGMEIELHHRQQMLLMPYIDWEKVEKIYEKHGEYGLWRIETSLGSSGSQGLSLDYLTSRQVLEDLRKQNPALVEELTAGLNLEPIEFQKSGAKLILPENGLHDAKINSEMKLQPRPLLGADGNPLKSTESSPIIRQGIIRPEGSAPTANQSGTFDLQRDWQTLNQRWNALDENVRRSHIRLALLSGDKQANVFFNMILHSPPELRVSGSYALSVTKIIRPDAPAVLRKFEMTRDMGAIEVRHKKPATSAAQALSDIESFAVLTNIGPMLNKPLVYNRRDSGLHIHFSVDPRDRPESLEPLARAWNHLILFKLIEAGVMDLFPKDSGAMVSYRSSLSVKGAVRLINFNRIEFRDHFAAPATELAMWMELVKLPNESALDKLYSEWLPRLTLAKARWLFLKNTIVFNEIFSDPRFAKNHPFEVTDALKQKWIVDYLTEFYAKASADSKFDQKLNLYSGGFSQETRQKVVELIMAKPHEWVTEHELGFVARMAPNSVASNHFIYRSVKSLLKTDPARARDASAFLKLVEHRMQELRHTRNNTRHAFCRKIYKSSEVR